MKIHTVTITGADDTTDIQQLVNLSTEFPFVEWGVLVSKSEEGNSRFPTRPWIDRFGEAAKTRRLKVAMHLCGRWMRELLNGELAWEDLPSVSHFAQSFQFNINGTVLPESTTGFFTKLAQRKALRSFIFQLTKASEPLVLQAQSNDFNVMGLYDNSGGKGKSPESGWPSPVDVPFPMGFAGGLGPDNVLDQLGRINAACGDQPYMTWIDMEGRIRTDDGSRLDLTRVRRVLEQVASSPFVLGASLRH
jgi:hypothetical protein